MHWWQTGVVYQIYPRSFQDSNGDGIGDLQGIIDRLDHLNGAPDSLGVDAVWLSPTFPSPMKDFGYDVADYVGVHPDFGDLATMDALIAACHARGIRVLLDYVPNHSSDQHPWFRASRSSRDNPFRDWYYWRDPRPNGDPPNNWLSAFGGGAWERDPATGQMYLHSFLQEQPDLNWRNPAVARAMHDVLRFWFRRGVDGFRIDVLGMVLKDPLMRDNPPNPHWNPATDRRERSRQIWQYNRNWPDVFGATRGLRAVSDEFPEKLLVGEVFGPAETLASYYGGAALDGLHLAFNFNLLGGYDYAHTAWDASLWRSTVDAAERALPPGAQPAWALGNHDQPRFISRYDWDGRGSERARAAAVVLLTLRGTPFLYYGEEIGMRDVAIPKDRLQDPARFRAIGRDPERTPMQWDGAPGGGFSTGEPWLPLGDLTTNVAAQRRDDRSLLMLYRQLIRLRRNTPALHEGAYAAHDGPADVFAFERTAERSRAFVAVNFALDERVVAIPQALAGGSLLRSSAPVLRSPLDGSALRLRPLEGCVIIA